MVLSEVLTNARSLPRPDQLRLIQELAASLVDSEIVIESGRDYAVWSPDSAFEAAATLMKTLDAPSGRT